MRSILGVTALVVIGLIYLLMMRLGSFKPVDIKIEDREPMTVIYKHHVGAYHKIVPVIEDVETFAKSIGQLCEISFGEYIDNPDTVAEDRLRSNGGCLVRMLQPKQMPDGFKYRIIPGHKFLIAQFDGAPSIGPMKVYPRAKEEIEKQGFVQTGPTFELYEVRPGDQVHTTYLFPITKAGVADTNPVSE